MKTLGDPHNGGKCVALCEDGRIYKPRSIFWEKELLSRASRFHALFKTCFTFELFPDLRFWISDSDPRNSGYVEPLLLQELHSCIPCTPSISEMIGKTIALLCWLGIGDLHRNNMAFGFTTEKKLVFCPWDIETIFNHFTLPTQTLLLPSPKLPLEKCGLFEVLQWMRDRNDIKCTAALCRGYLVGLSTFEKHGPKLESDLLAWKEILGIPVRVFPRATREYRQMLKSIRHGVRPEAEIAESEWIQLERGDIPYFFRKLGQRDILWHLGENRVEDAQLPPQLEHRANAHLRLPTRRQFPARKLEILKKAGVLQLAKFFLNGSYGKEEYENLSLTADEKLFLSWNILRIQCVR